MPAPVVEISIDHREVFTTKTKFQTRNELMDWVREEARKVGSSVVIGKSDNGGNGRNAFVTLICERGGTYIEYNKLQKRNKIAGSVKCGCPFRVRGYLLIAGYWSLKVNDGKHNHDMAEVLKGHKTVGRLNPNEKDILRNLTDSNVPPRHILTSLRKRNSKTATTIKHIYNARTRHRKSVRGPRSEMQHLMKSLVEHKYVYHVRNYANSQNIKDIFWAHLESIKLFNTFPTVLIMDSTYKTNKYRLPLLEFVGVTSTYLTYSIAFAYMMSEKEESVTWALEKCRGLFKSVNMSPEVVVTDRDNALMKAVDEVFPKATTLLCEYHIGKNVRARCKTDCKVKEGSNIKPMEVVNAIIDVWEPIVFSQTEQEYMDNCMRLKTACANFPKFLEYVETTILGPVKEKVVRFWTNRVMHLGNTTTNRAESAHSRLKKYLNSSMGDMSTNWDVVHDMLESQYTSIHASFQTSMIMLEHRFKDKVLWSNLVRNVSRKVMHLLADEEERTDKCGTDASKCGCLITVTYKLLCAYSIAKKKNAQHSHWIG